MFSYNHDFKSRLQWVYNSSTIINVRHSCMKKNLIKKKKTITKPAFNHLASLKYHNHLHLVFTILSTIFLLQIISSSFHLQPPAATTTTTWWSRCRGWSTCFIDDDNLVYYYFIFFETCCIIFNMSGEIPSPVVSNNKTTQINRKVMLLMKWTCPPVVWEMDRFGCIIILYYCVFS